ncbi:MAG: hypothetical protein GF350_01415 [Chitinivibrionales bacterium]|nr:hypothetical protein [Chitinivibrionales bacterium]
MKGYPKYKNCGVDWLGNIPEHWQMSKLKWVLKIKNGESVNTLFDD